MLKTKNMMPHIIVIGGGATGCGVARDLVLRGYQTTLVECHILIVNYLLKKYYYHN